MVTATPTLTSIKFPNPRYIRKGKCNRCGWCCLQDNCEYLMWNGDITFCKIYKDRFLRCRLFPEAPPILNNDCGYYFLDTWENNKIVKRHL